MRKNDYVQQMIFFALIIKTQNPSNMDIYGIYTIDLQHKILIKNHITVDKKAIGYKCNY